MVKIVFFDDNLEVNNSSKIGINIIAYINNEVYIFNEDMSYIDIKEKIEQIFKGD